MTLPTRKASRLKDYNYSEAGAYFITICTKDRKNLFGTAVGASIARPQPIPLSPYGTIADTAIQNIHVHYPAVQVDNYVIMPNHIHLLLRITNSESGRPMVAPTISTVIQQFKGVVTKQLGFPVWQKLFYDHIIRNQCDYREIWNYIDNNPAVWEKDRFFLQEKN